MSSEYRISPPKAPDPVVESVPVKPIEGSTPIDNKIEKKQDENPTSVEYFGVEGWGEMLLEPKLDVYGITSKIIEIEKFIKSKISDLGAKDEPESRKQILKNLENSLRLSDIQKPHHRIDRVHSIIKYMDEFDSEKQRRDLIILSLNKKFKK